MKTNASNDDRYYSDDDRWGNESADFESFDFAVTTAMDLFDIDRCAAADFCAETENRGRENIMHKIIFGIISAPLSFTQPQTEK